MKYGRTAFSRPESEVQACPVRLPIRRGLKPFALPFVAALAIAADFTAMQNRAIAAPGEDP